ncbi:MAG TPA: D-2-hydroxyacid dehydrogenase [Thermomicrobiaceae bacterium]|nr:D-2-hydroxyacid dehydrogenase [Thermomicrobiaceae bacterium]
MAELTRLVVAFNLDPRYLARIRDTYPGLEVVVQPERERLAEALPGAQAMVGRGLTPELLAAAPDLRWLQITGAGVENLLFPALVASDVVVTNFSGVHAPNMAEHLVTMMLAFARGLPELMRYQVRHEWHHADRGTFELGGQTLGVLGLGDIGNALAWRAHALGMRVVGLKRRASEPPPGVARVYLPDELPALLAEADHVASCLPLTPRTRHLLGAPEFAAMRPGAYVYNVGRGAVIDQDALVAALRAGQVAGAGLDVTDPEPLPADSPLWDMPNVLITMHTSGGSPSYWERGIEVLLDNIGRYRRDEPLRNVVDKREGY